MEDQWSRNRQLCFTTRVQLLIMSYLMNLKILYIKFILIRITALVCHVKLPLQAHNLCSCRHLERHQDYLNYQCFQSQSTRNHILLSPLLTPLFMFRGKTQTNKQTQNKQVLFVCQATFLWKFYCFSSWHIWSSLYNLN